MEFLIKRYMAESYDTIPMLINPFAQFITSRGVKICIQKH